MGLGGVWEGGGMGGYRDKRLGQQAKGNGDLLQQWPGEF
jgi:hypothetical protein